MTNEEYIELHPEQFKDKIDKWLFTEFGILGGCCSAEKSHEYAIARMVAEKLFELKEEEMQSTIELAEEHAMLAGMNRMEEQMMAKAVDAHCFGMHFGMQMQGYALFSFRLPADEYRVGSEVKVIVIKEGKP